MYHHAISEVIMLDEFSHYHKDRLGYFTRTAGILALTNHLTQVLFSVFRTLVFVYKCPFLHFLSNFLVVYQEIRDVIHGDISYAFSQKASNQNGNPWFPSQSGIFMSTKMRTNSIWKNFSAENRPSFGAARNRYLNILWQSKLKLCSHQIILRVYPKLL